jgi:branched-chain amino acid transport system ATP-binding protein
VPAADYILETRGLTKDFKGFVAVSDVNLRVRRGAIHGLIGPNGAGKTTVFNLLTRFVHPSAGAILFGGRDITRERPADIARRGVVRSFQISSTFGHMSVLDNVCVALQRKLGVSFHFWRSRRVLEALKDEALSLLDSVDLRQHSELKAAELPYGQKRALELATTLALDPQLMLLDEPTQGMAHEDVGRVVALIRKVSANRTVLMVEHNLGVVQDLCDTITVMQRGSILAEGSYETLTRNPEVREAYMGATDE